MKKISSINWKLETDDIQEHRYPSIDDWFDPREWTGELRFKTVTADTGNIDYNFLILLHAMIEQYLCFKHHISDIEVTKYDMEHEGTCRCGDPGSHEDAPYHVEHRIAEDIEAGLSVKLLVDWSKYDKAINKTVRRWKKKV